MMPTHPTKIEPFNRAHILEALLMGLIGYVCFGYYEVVGRLAALRGQDFSSHLATRLDAAIPFVPIFVIPYALAFVMPIVTAVAVARFGGLFELRRIFFVYLGLLFAHFGIYLLFPTSAAGIMLQDSSLPAGILAEGVRFFYHLAPPWNAFPSFHVAGCWFFYRTLASWAPRAAKAYLAWFWMMFAGTVAIKIHWLVDSAAGWLAAEVVYRLISVRLEERNSCSWTWSSSKIMLATYLVPLAVLATGLGVSLNRLR